MRVLHAPVNIAGQPIAAVRELRRQGVDAELLQYGEGHAFGYSSGRLVPFRGRHRLEVQVEALEQALAEEYDIFHLWMATFFASPRIPGRGEYQYMHGLDLPFLKVRGKKIVYRCTDFDVRRASLHAAVNPYNPFRYGYEPLFSEEAHRDYLAYLRDYVDVFIVQDPELHEFMPQARVVPRGLDLSAFPEVGIEPAERPLVVHAPSKTELKGTRFILQGLDELRDEGIPFELRLIEGMSHAEALELYKRADLVVDQLMIGWYGVLTVEALALGKPVVVRVREDLRRAFTREIPVAGASPDTIKDVLRTALTDFEYRRALAERSRAYVEEVHDVRSVAAKLRSIYEEVLPSPATRPETAADLNWLWSRYRASEESELELINEVRLAQFRRLPLSGLGLALRARRGARRSRRLLAQLNALRAKERSCEQATSPEVVEKARRYDRLAPEITESWEKARELDALRRLEALVRETNGAGREVDPSLLRRRLGERVDQARKEITQLRREGERLRGAGSGPLARPQGQRRPWKPAGPAARLAKTVLSKGSPQYQFAYDVYWWFRKGWNRLLNRTLYRVF
jgi:glycosyltransferase involved in cell wall biosynthesis